MAEGVNKEFMRTLGHVLLPHVFITGPYVYEHIHENVKAAIELADELYTSGICLPIIQHSTFMWDSVNPHDEEFWLEYSLQIMKRCDAVLVYDADHSMGSIREVAEAQRLDIPVFWSTDELHTWAESGAE